MAVITISDISMHSTNAKWEDADLQDVHKVNALGQVLLYRQINVGKASVVLEHETGIKDAPYLCLHRHISLFLEADSLEWIAGLPRSHCWSMCL